MFSVLISGLLLLGSVGIYAKLRYYHQDLQDLLSLRHELLLDPQTTVRKHCRAEKSGICTTDIATRKSPDICSGSYVSFAPRRYYYLQHRCLTEIELTVLR